MTATLDWIVSAGLLALVIGFIYRGWETWRGRQRELKGLMYLLNFEVSRNQRTLSEFIEEPDSVTRNVGKLVQTNVWNEIKVQLAYLLENQDHFRTIAYFYYILDDAMLSVIHHKHLSDTIKEDFVSTLSLDLLEQGREVQDIINMYISAEEENKYSVKISLTSNRPPEE